jgi:hypothetical protein
MPLGAGPIVAARPTTAARRLSCVSPSRQAIEKLGSRHRIALQQIAGSDDHAVYRRFDIVALRSCKMPSSVTSVKAISATRPVSRPLLYWSGRSCSSQVPKAVQSNDRHAAAKIIKKHDSRRRTARDQASAGRDRTICARPLTVLHFADARRFRPCACPGPIVPRRLRRWSRCRVPTRRVAL